MTEKRNDFLSLLSFERESSERENSKYYISFEFSHTLFSGEFPCGQDKKEQGFQLILYIIHYTFFYSYPDFNLKPIFRISKKMLLQLAILM